MVAEVMMIFRSGPLGQQLLQITQQKIDVEAALVGLVDDQGIVLVEVGVLLDLRQQDAVGHQLDVGLGPGAVAEAHLVAHRAARLHPQLTGDTGSEGAGRDAPRLGMADVPSTPRPRLRQIFGSWVDLPEPVSPHSTITWCLVISALISSSRAVMGSSAGKFGSGSSSRRRV